MFDKLFPYVFLLAYPVLLTLGHARLDFFGAFLLWFLLVLMVPFIALFTIPTASTFAAHRWGVWRSLVQAVALILFSLSVMITLSFFVPVIGENAACVFGLSVIGCFALLLFTVSACQYNRLKWRPDDFDADYRRLRTFARFSFASILCVFIAFSVYLDFFSGLPVLDWKTLDAEIIIVDFWIAREPGKARIYTHTLTAILIELWILFFFVFFIFQMFLRETADENKYLESSENR